jgi:cytochrome P450
MRLVSDTFENGGPKGPVNPRVHAAMSPVMLADPGTFADGPPHEAFRLLRAQAPVAWNEEASPRQQGFWSLTRYADVLRVDTDPETFSSQRGGILMAYGRVDSQMTRAALDAMICMDAPQHVQLRRAHMGYFTPSYLQGVKAKVAAETTRLLDAMAPLGACDLVESLSAQLPLFTLCEILGVPAADRARFLHWMHYLEKSNSLRFHYEGLSAPPGEIQIAPEDLKFLDDFAAATGEMFDYGLHMLKRRRADPQNDLMSAIACAEVDGERLSDGFLTGSWLLIVFAGNDTTRNTISGSMSLLSRFPEEKAKLIARPQLLPNAVNEFIRMISPVMYMRRTATRDTEIGGQRIAEGEKVIMYYVSANRDEAMFEDPDRLDVERANADKNIAFGQGPHVCIGKRVAQMQLEEVYRQILSRFPDMRQAGPMEVEPNNFVYAIRKLPVEFTPQRA